MRTIIRATISVGTIVLLADAADAQGRSIQGVVLDSGGIPVPYVNITFQSGRRTLGDAEGRFRFSSDSAGTKIQVRRIGFLAQTITVASLADTNARIVMAPIATALSGVKVAASRVQSLATHGFYDRQAEVERGINHGFFITPEEFEQRPGARVTDLLRQFPAIKVTRVKEDGRDGRFGYQAQGLNGCRMEVYVDGSRFYNVAQPRNYLEPGSGLFIDESIPTNTIAAVEIYPRSVTAPPKYQSLNGTCGVILIWTK